MSGEIPIDPSIYAEVAAIGTGKKELEIKGRKSVWLVDENKSGFDALFGSKAGTALLENKFDNNVEIKTFATADDVRREIATGATPDLIIVGSLDGNLSSQNSLIDSIRGITTNNKIVCLPQNETTFKPAYYFMDIIEKNLGERETKVAEEEEERIAA